MVINLNKTNYFSKLVKLTVVLSILPLLFIIFFPGKIAIITMICSYPLIIARLYLKNKTNNFDANFYIRLFQAYFLIVLLRGFINDNSEDDWKILFSMAIPLYLFVHFAMYLPTNIQAFANILQTFFSLVFILVIITFVFDIESSPYLLSPIYIILLMMPYMGKKFILFVLLLSIFSFVSDIANRSNMLNITVAFLISLTFIFKNSKAMLNLIIYLRAITLLFPILFLVLGLSGIFNIFLIGEAYTDLKISNGGKKEQVLLVDSRTSIYKDVFQQLVKDDAMAFGLGATGRTETSLADNLNAQIYSTIYKEGRPSTESGMLNYIQWGGIVGGFVYFMLFIKASYYGLFKSNNWFCKMLSLWVAYKAMYSFVEDKLTFSITSLFILISIGICLNKKIRQLKDNELKLFFKFVVNKNVILRVLKIR
ncbi:hypothetical protein [Polaribacter sp. M15]